jgi:hypothetical protein
MGTISKGSAKRRSKETKRQKIRKTKIVSTVRQNNLRNDELNVLK